VQGSHGDSQVEVNKQKIRRMLECISRGDLAGFGAGLAPGYIRHCQAMPSDLQEIRGKEAMLSWLTDNGQTFPDYSEEIEYLVGEGDMIAWRSRGRGTMTGPMGPFPPTGKVMDISIIGMHRFENGLVAETWTSWDNVAALMQLGLMPGNSDQ